MVGLSEWAWEGRGREGERRASMRNEINLVIVLLDIELLDRRRCRKAPKARVPTINLDRSSDTRAPARRYWRKISSPS